jgi:beta-glucosidase
VVGKSADSLQNQTGGWTLTWQGTGNTNADFPNGTTILGGLRKRSATANVTFDETGDVDPKGYDAVIAVIGETPYAEGVGDLTRKTLEAAKLYPRGPGRAGQGPWQGCAGRHRVRRRPPALRQQGAQPLRRVRRRVAAGHRGGGVADMLVKGKNNGGYRGKLSYSWPKAACQTPLNAGTAGYDPLFPLGYGLGNGQNAVRRAARRNLRRQLHPRWR